MEGADCASTLLGLCWFNWPNHFSLQALLTAPAHSPAKSRWQTLGEGWVRNLGSLILVLG